MSRILFIDRDGVLIEEPADEQVDAYDKLRLVKGVISALLRLRDAGFEFVMVSNQDGLGTPAYPRAAFDGPQSMLLQILESQGIVFREVLIDEHYPADNAPTRKPGIGLVLHYLRDRSIDTGGAGCEQAGFGERCDRCLQLVAGRAHLFLTGGVVRLA